MAAAIRSLDGRSSKTIIYEYVMKEFQLNRLRELIDCVYQAESPRKVIASAAKLVSAAARDGDEVAREILCRAGEEMALQCKALLAKLGDSENRPFTISGSAWKGYRGMFDSFVHSLDGVVQVVKPKFEPVMGGVIAQALHEGAVVDEALISKLENNFQMFKYTTQW